jgi:LacI family transcriptional regulator
MGQVNLKTLAKELNLSISTVSKALRDSYEIGKDTKEKVKALAEKLNYEPNPFASSLRKKSSKTIAVIIPEISNNFFALAIDGIQAIAQERGYHVLTYLTHEALINEISTVNHLVNGRVDGVLMSICSEKGTSTHLKLLSESEMPIVFFDRVSENSSAPTVTTDDYESGFKGTEHLIEAGCKKIAFLAASKHLSIINKRMNGYINALEKNNIAYDPSLVIECASDAEESMKIIKQSLQTKNRPDGIFASVETLAIATYHVCSELEIGIPADIKILSFSNLRTASLLAPSLTTITQPAFEIGKESASILFRQIEKKQLQDYPDKVVIKSSLIPRESTSNS